MAPPPPSPPPSCEAAAPAHVRVLVRVRPLSEAEQPRTAAPLGTPGPAGRGAAGGVLTLDPGTGRPGDPLDFGAAGGEGGSKAPATEPNLATVTVAVAGSAGSAATPGYDSDGHGGPGGGRAGGGGRTFQFDAVHGPESTQADVFGSVRGIVDAVAAG